VSALVWLPVATVVAVAMDFWAAFLHGCVWHRWLWFIHRSHHTTRPGEVRLESNDALSVLHAPLAIALILVGCQASPGLPREIAFGVGVGMSAFGMAYLVVHDGLVHGRLPVRFLLRLRYFRGVANAHRVHHGGTAGGAPFGFFAGVWELTRALPRSERIRGSSGPPS
jgi:beta-carotene 3-hydroxylase